jgi:hypothetical protein
MTFKDFLEQAEKNQLLADYLDDIAQTAAPHEGLRTSGLDVFFVVAGWALLKVIKHHLDAKRSIQEVNLRRLMEQEIDEFVARGYTRQEAVAAVVAVSKAITERPPDDAIVRAGLALLEAKKDSSTS